MSRERQQLKAIGTRIREFRKKARTSQEKLAEKADLHPVYIGKIERGEQWISLRALLRIAEALGVRVSELLRTSANSFLLLFPVCSISDRLDY